MAHYAGARRRGVLFARVETLHEKLWAASKTATDRRLLRRMLRGDRR